MAKKKVKATKASKAPSRAIAGAKKKARPSSPGNKAVKKVPAIKKAKAPEEPSLGRPKVTGEELLYMLFKEDYHARQIFDFLKVERVRELEEYSPQQIVKLLSRPITDTVDRIRRKLAEKNRALRDDREFAAEQKTT